MAGKGKILADLSIRVSASTAELEKNLKDATKSLSEFKGSAKEAASNITKSFAGIDAGTSSFKDMKKAMMELRNISITGKSKEEIMAINKEIGRLGDEMGDLRAMQKGLGTEFGSLAAQGLQAIAAIAEVAVGTAVLFGASEEDAKKYQATMVQVIGIVQGLGVVQEALGNKIFQTIAVRIKDTAATVAQTVAQWALNTSLLAMMATIGLVIVAVAAVAAGVYYLVKAFDRSAEATENANKRLEEYKNKNKGLTAQEELSIKVLKKRGATEEQINKVQEMYLNQRIKREEDILDTLQRRGKYDEEIAKQIPEQEALVASLKDEVMLLGVAEDLKGNKTKDSNDKAMGSYDKLTTTVKMYEDSIRDIIAGGGVVSEGMIKKLQEYKIKLFEVNEAIDKAFGVRKDITPIVGKTKIPEIPVKITPEWDTKKAKEQHKTIVDDYKKSMEGAIAYEKNLREGFASQINEFLKGSYSEDEANRRASITAIADFAAQSAMSLIDSISKFQEAAMNLELEAAGSNEEEKDKIRKKYAKKQKATAILMAIINGALGVTKAFAELGPIAGAIAAGLVAISTAAQIAVISSQPLAKGGIAYGETLATVGEYPGAKSNPEVIAPLDKLKTLIGRDATGFNGGQVRFVIEQDQLVGILSQASQKQIYF